METEGQLWELKAKACNLLTQHLFTRTLDWCLRFCFLSCLPVPSLSTGVPQFTPGNRAWVLTLSDRTGQTYLGTAMMPWQIMVSTKVNLPGWLVTTAWECSQKDHFETDNCFVPSLYFLCLTGVSLCFILFPWPICGVCWAQMGSSKNLLSYLVFSKHMYTEKVWRLVTRPNVGAFSQGQQITEKVSLCSDMLSCRLLWNGFSRAYQWNFYKDFDYSFFF